MKRGSLVVLDRNWSSYSLGDRFKVTEIVEGGGPHDAKNVRAVLESVPDAGMDDIFHRRTLPAEYCVEVPTVGSSITVNANQGDRDGTVLAVLGSEMLLEYEMPAGRTFLRIQNFVTGAHRAVSQLALPKKWKKELEA